MPELCYAVDHLDGELIVIMYGESGYRKTELNCNSPEENRKTADRLNERLGVTPEQEYAMVMGSLFGFDKPAANPATNGITREQAIKLNKMYSTVEVK